MQDDLEELQRQANREIEELQRRAQVQQSQQAQPSSVGDRRGAVGSSEAARKRRHTIRHNCQAQVEMRIGYSLGGGQDLGSDTIKVKSRVLDLSTAGTALFTRERFEVGQELGLTLKTRDGAKIHTACAVRWVKPIPDKDGYACGCEFAKISVEEQMKIAKFLRELDATLGM